MWNIGTIVLTSSVTALRFHPPDPSYSTRSTSVLLTEILHSPSKELQRSTHVTQTTSRRAALAGMIGGAAALASLATAPDPAFAAFGPGGASATSPAPVKPFSVETWLGLDSAKSQQRAGALSAPNAKRVVAELQDRLSNIEGDLTSVVADVLEQNQDVVGDEILDKIQGLMAQQEKGRQERELIIQLQKRAAILEKLEQQPLWVISGAAVFASFGSTLVMHPIDTLKTMSQSRTADDTESDYDSPDNDFNFLSLYKGLVPNLVKEGPPSGIYLSIYEVVKSHLLQIGTLPPLLIYLLAGAAGEVVGSLARAPSEATKTRTQSGAVSGAGEALAELIAAPSEVLSVWVAILVRDVPFGAIQIALFECVKTAILQNPNIDIDVNTLWAEACLGALGGGVGSFLTCPFDVVTTRLITQPQVTKKLDGLEMARLIYSEGGAGAFFNGVGARVGYWAPAIAIFLSLYCRLRTLGLQYMP